MTCTGFDAVTMDLCQKIEHVSSKYDKPFMEVLNRIMEFHTSWEGETDCPKLPAVPHVESARLEDFT